VEIQFATVIRGGNDKPQVVVRIHGPGEVDQAASILNEASEKLPALMAGLVSALENTGAPGAAVAALQKAGLNPQVVPAPPSQEAPAPQSQNAYQALNDQQAAPPAWSGQQAPQQPQAPAPQGQDIALPPGPCPFCKKNPICPDCNGATLLGVINARGGRKLNKHKCSTYGHRGVMCQTPIWRSRQAAAAPVFGGRLPDGLVYEQ